MTAISYPLTFPTSIVPNRVAFSASSTVGVQASPFTGKQTAYVQQRELWGPLTLGLPPMPRAKVDEILGFIDALNGMEGSFLMVPPGYTTARGTWATDSPLVKGASQTGKQLIVDGLTASATVKRGDFFQLGTTTGTHLHRISMDGTANGSGEITLNIWPRLRVSPADNDSLVLVSPQGIWRLASNTREWSLDLGMHFGLSIQIMEYLV